MPNEPKYYPLDQSPLYKLSSRSKLARLLGMTNPELQGALAGESLYREFTIPKKNGGTRDVENPCRTLKLVQERLARRLSKVAPPDFLFCPVKRRCYVANAARHKNARAIRCLDIKKFYPNTPARRVFWFFNSVLRCSRDIAALLTRLATYKEHLPTGSPLSPILAYFSFYDLWQEIAALCAVRGQTLSVYVDDITISGDRVTRADMWPIKQLLARYGLDYHKEKEFFDRPAEITGVIVAGGRLFVPDRQLLKLHTARCNLKTAGDHEFLKWRGTVSGLEGQMAQIRAHADRLSQAD